MNNQFVSIIIPTYNKLSQLKKAINSILKQTYQNFEVIIVDNNSIDGTKSYLKTFNKENIKYIEISNNGNIAMSRNLGIKNSKGSIVAFLDSDDYWVSSKLQKSLYYLEKDYDFTYHDMHLVNDNYKIIKKGTGYTRKLSNQTYNDLLFNGPAFPTSSVMLKKKIFEDVNLFDESKELITWEDYDAWIRISKLTNKFKMINETLGCLTINGKNLSNDNTQLENIINFKKKYFKHNNFPDWCLIRFAKIYFKKKNFLEALKAVKKIKFNKLGFKNFIILGLIYLICRIAIYKL